MDVKFKRLLNAFSSILISPKLFIYLGVLSILPLILISFFNNPASDDFYYAYHSKNTNPINAGIWIYNHEGGRYFANGLLCFNPLTYNNYFFFKIIPILLLLLFVFSIRTFITTLFKYITSEKTYSIVGLILVLFYIQIPEINTALYWITGAVTYQLPMSLSLLLASTLIKFYRSKKIQYLFFSVLLIAMIVGCNEVALFSTLILLGFITIYNTIIVKKTFLFLYFLIAITTVFSIIEFTAPGNFIRVNKIPIEHDFFYSFQKSILYSILYFLKWFPIILLFCTYYSEQIYSYLKKDFINNNVIIKPWFAIVLLFSILFFSSFVGFYINKDILPGRVLNLLYFYYLFIALYSIICFIHYFKIKFDFHFLLMPQSKLVLGIIIIFFTISETPIFNAYQDLLSGKAYKYDLEMKNRFELIKISKNEVVVPALIKKPKTIYNEGIMGLTTNVKNWKNEELSDYFHKQIVVKSTDTTFTE